MTPPPINRTARLDGMSLFFLALALGAGAVLYRRGGAGAVALGLEKGVFLLIAVTPIVLLAVVLAGYAQTLIPRRWSKRAWARAVDAEARPWLAWPAR